MKKYKKKDFIKHKFPTFSRIIFEKSAFNKKIPKRVLYMLLVWIVFLIPTGVISLHVYTSFTQNQKVKNERTKTEEEIDFWKKMVNSYTDFRDGYFQLAVLEYRLNDFAKARSYLEKVLEIDPNFKEGRDFEKLLQ